MKGSETIKSVKVFEYTKNCRKLNLDLCSGKIVERK